MNISIDDIKKINEITNRDLTSDDIYVFQIVLCNNDIDEDYEKLSLNALQEMKDMFIGVPGIFNGKTVAKIFDCSIERVKNGTTKDGKQLHQLKAKAFMMKTNENMPLIKEIESGLKEKVSISCSLREDICSICGNDKRTSNCKHVNGESHNGKIAYSVLNNVCDVYEFSFSSASV